MFGKTLSHMAFKVWIVYTANPHAVWNVHIIEFYTFCPASDTQLRDPCADWHGIYELYFGPGFYCEVVVVSFIKTSAWNKIFTSHFHSVKPYFWVG